MNYWFKNKKYGYGWYPANWKGWLVIIVYALDLVIAAVLINALVTSTTWFVFYFCLFTAIETICLLLICYITGEKLKSSWGNTEKS